MDIYKIRARDTGAVFSFFFFFLKALLQFPFVDYVGEFFVS